MPYTILMQKHRDKPKFWGNINYWLYHLWGELYTRWQEIFNPKWREPLPPIPCQFCGQTDYKEAYCPNLRKMGFILDETQERSNQN